MLCWHKWNKWSMLVYDNTRFKHMQFRTCSRCGKAQSRAVAQNYVRSDEANKAIQDKES